MYYNGSGGIVAWSVEPMHPQGDNIEELKQDLHRMLEACEKPVLDMKELEKSVGKEL